MALLKAGGKAKKMMMEDEGVLLKGWQHGSSRAT